MPKKKTSTAIPLIPTPPQPAAAIMPADEDKVTLITKEGLEKLKEELQYLKDVRRKEVAERIREAISYGDLSENAEYEEAKNEQAFLEGRILELEEKIKHAKIIEEHPKRASETVSLGSHVVIVNIGGKSKKEEEFIIVGSTEADSLNRKISNESPVGKALLDRKQGDIVKIQAPGGVMQYKILKVA